MAAPILSYEGLGLVQGTGWLFQDLDIYIGARDRLALIGRNGAGKTTLLKLLAGYIEPDKGKRTIVPGTHVVLLEQEPDFTGHATLMDYATSGDHAPEAHEVAAIADQLGIDMDRAAASASGGERRRAAIARALAQNPDVLLLDEPTNHLDLAAIDWLESWLSRFTGAFVAISHDRTFLTRLTRQTLWLDRGSIRRKEIGFGGFDEWTEAVFAEEARAAQKLDSKLRLEAHWLERGVTARRKRNQGRLARLDQMRASRAALIGSRGKLKLDVQQGESRSRMVIEAENIAKSVPAPEGGERVLVKDFSTLILRGDKLGIVGPNGAGKSTLIKMLIGELAPDSGRIKIADALAVAYFDQRRQQLDPKATLRDVLCPKGGDTVFVQGQPRHVRGYLKDFLFDPRQADSPTGTLSGGERNRLLLAKILATPADLLVLDEPTNDLDTDTLDLLEDLLADFTGTLLVVSHDRDFLDKTVSSVVVMPGDGSATDYAGGFTDAMAQRRAGTPAAAAKAAEKKSPRPDETRPARQPTRLSYKDQRELDQLPERIGALEAEIATLEARLADSGLYARDAAAAEGAMRRHAAAKAELAALEDRWLELEEQRTARERDAKAS
ncbi:MAG: ATP-binding cassette domain-containing protein [Rhodospirillaceae bacterium]|nr:ATP-binding cassette domain-containing protein [Rhodospirillaceae bacterium]